MGAPWAGGWMQWPARWLIATETARSVYDTLTAVNRALNTLEGDALDTWRNENSRLLDAALAIERLRNEGEEDGR